MHRNERTDDETLTSKTFGMPNASGSKKIREKISIAGKRNAGTVLDHHAYK